MHVLALPRYDRLAASTRQRFEQYEPFLAEAGIRLDYAPLLGNDYLQRISEGRGQSRLSTATAYVRRLRTLLGSRRYDLLWIHCELFPFLPGWAERLGPAMGRPVVYDCDDAFFHRYDQSGNAVVRALLAQKLEPLLKRADACTCGNEYLRDYTARFCPNSIVLPTIVDTSLYLPHPRSSGDGSTPVIGWIGSPSTWTYVRPLLPLLAEIAASGKARIRVIGAGARAEADRFPGMDLIDWTEEGEIAEVQQMDIGIMPLPDDPWARGKSGYKLIQYMACGLPVIASPVGVNAQLVRGENGFLADTPEQWRDALGRLLADPALRERFGAAGRRIAVEEYSLAVHAPRLVRLFQSLVPNGSGRRSASTEAE